MKQSTLLVIIGVVLLGGGITLGYYIATGSKVSPVIAPTPTATGALPSATEIPVITTTLPTTVLPTAIPTTTLVKKSGNIKEFTNGFTLALTVEVPADVTVTETKVGSWNGLVLKKGNKNFMAFNLPYELYETQGYSSATAVTSSINNLKRVRSKKVFANSGTYSFAVAYVTSTLAGKDCTENMMGDATTSPCATPAFTYNSNIWLSAYCSVDTSYIAICDRVMKTLSITKK
jgi:hypothetical protein